MSAIQDCLSRFTVAVWSNAPTAAEDVDRAISVYLAEHGEDRASRLRALTTLRDCYGRVQTQSPMSDAVRAAIDRRIGELDPLSTAA